MKVKIVSILIAVLLTATFSFSQTKIKSVAPQNTSNAQTIKSTAAFAELLLRRTERESELEEFAVDYTEEYPKVKEIKFELSLLTKEMDKLLAVGAADAGKLSLALGKLMVRKTELDTDLWNLSRQYNADHLEVKRAKRKVDAFAKAIREILP